MKYAKIFFGAHEKKKISIYMYTPVYINTSLLFPFSFFLFSPILSFQPAFSSTLTINLPFSPSSHLPQATKNKSNANSTPFLPFFVIIHRPTSPPLTLSQTRYDSRSATTHPLKNSTSSSSSSTNNNNSPLRSRKDGTRYGLWR